MKICISRLAPLFLLCWLLPACVEHPGYPPPPRQVETVSPDESLFQGAEASYRRQAYGRAYQGYAQYLERYPQGPHATEARLREAELLGIQGDWLGALQGYQAILARQPEPEMALKARYGIGRAYFKLGQYQEASQILDSLTAVGDLPRSLWFSTQALLAEIALKENHVPQAFSRLRLAAQDLASGDQEWFEDLKSRVVAAASPADLESLATMYRDSPLAAALVLRLARLSQESGQTEEAQKWFGILEERYPTSPEAAAARRPSAGGKVTLGCLLPLSGDLSNVGFRVQRGMELALRQAPLKLIFKDTQNDPGTAAQLVQELAQDPQVLAIIGPLSAGVAQAAANEAQNAGIPLLAMSQKAEITQTGNLIFQALLTPRQQVRTLVQGAMGLGIQRYAILYPDSAYGRTFLQIFQEELAAAAGLALAAQESYAVGTQDFSPELTSLKGALQTAAAGTPGTVALFIPDDAAVVAAVAEQLPMASLGGTQILGTNLVHNPRLTPEQLAALQGVVFPDAFFPGDPSPAVQELVKAYREQYGEDPDYLATQGYAIIRLLGQLAQSDPLDRAALPQKLQALRPIPEVPWFKGFNAQREEEAAVYLLTIKDNQVQMLSPQPSPPIGGRGLG